MDPGDRRLKSIIRKISPKELVGSELQDQKLIYSVIGFIEASDYADNALLLSNLGYTLAKRGLHTCMVDLKVFYPNLHYFLNTQTKARGEGLIKLLKSDKHDFREEISATPFERLYLLSPSPQDLVEEYFDFEIAQVERVIATLKQMFDVVLLNIPNNPPLEFCLGAMKASHFGFFTAAERLDAAANMMKLLDFASSVGISTAKFTSVIFTNVLGANFDYKILEQSGFKTIATLPMVRAATELALDGKLYVKDNPLVHKHFLRGIEKIADLIANDQRGS